MRSLILMLTLIATGSGASALSCKPQNFAEEFNRIARAVELYTVAYGTLRLAGALQSYERGQPREVLFEFNGTFMGRRNSQKLTRAVTVKTTCSGDWCGQIPPEGKPMLMFLENERNSLSLTSAACGGDFFIEPSLGKVAAIRACMRLGLCGDAEKAAFDLNR